MKAMSLKGVLRTEIQPSHDRVTVVGDVDVKVLVKKLARVGKIAEPLPPAPAAFEQCKKRDDGDRAAQAQVEEKRKGKGDAGDKAAAAAAASEQEGCKKCAGEAASRAEGGGGVDGDRGSGKKTPSPKDGTAGWTGEEGGDADEFDTKPPVAVAADHRHAQAQVQQHYHRAEPPTVVPMHVPAYYAPPAAAVPYYGYHGMPPPPPVPVAMAMGVGVAQRHHPQVRPQPSRFDEDFFNDDNTVGCSVM